jgi:hypothetical protein
METLRQRAERSGRPEGVIFLGDAQHGLGDGDGGGVNALEADPPLVAATDGAGVVHLSLDLRTLHPLPAPPVPLFLAS